MEAGKNDCPLLGNIVRCNGLLNEKQQKCLDYYKLDVINRL